MKNKFIKSLLVATVIVPSVSFAFLNDVSDGLDKVSNSAKKTTDMSNKTKAKIDKYKNYGNDTDAKQYVSNKIDENTNKSLSKSRDAKDSLSKTKDSYKSFF